MLTRKISYGLGVALLVSTANLHAALVIAQSIVDARTMIFSAADNGIPDPAGVVPTAIALPAGIGRVFFVTSTSGSTTPLQGFPQYAADGGNFLGVAPYVYAYGGIAGIRDQGTENVMGLIGIFTAGTPSPATRPPDRDITLEKDLATIPTLLNQPFFIGDGHGAGNVLQTFMVPDQATQFWFGFADAVPQAAVYVGPPGNYFDNAGELTVNYTIVPEPAAGSLMVVATLFGPRRRRGRSGTPCLS